MDPAAIRRTLRSRYAKAARNPQGQFPYPIGYSGIVHHGYADEIAGSVPAEVAHRYLGVGNPFSPVMPKPGENVLDIGCGAGFDSLFAARCIGPGGRVIGVDISPEMLALATEGARKAGIECAAFVQAGAEGLPVPDDWADLVISNGALNLSTCKTSSFAEIHRVLRPGGRFQAVDLILTRTLPHDLRNDEFAWSG